MRRWAAAAAAAALTAGGGAGLAGSAAAQHPGADGQLTYTADGDDARWPGCFHGDRTRGAGYYLARGGAAFSPDGRRYAAVVDGGGGEAAGSGERYSGGYAVVVGRAGAASCARPTVLADADRGSRLSFSPDGRDLAVTQHGDVHVVSATSGRDVRDLTPGSPSTTETDPAWDPRGRTIAYTAPDGIRTQLPTGGPSTLLVPGPATSPDYSPDGRYLGYVDGTGHIATVDAVTGAPVRRTPVVATRFVWSPDGRSLFSSDDGPSCRVSALDGTLTSRVGGEAVCTVTAWGPRT